MRWERFHYENRETIVTFLCDSRFLDPGKKALIRSRTILENTIRKDSVFRTTLQPYICSEKSPCLIRKMCEEGRKIGVGPMATVAGALAQESLMAILDASADEAVVDNGGDMAFFIRKPIRVGIYAGNTFPRELAFEVEPKDRPFGICTSSGTVGHSFSFGKSDAAVVISSNVVLADAAATALGNRVREESDLETCFDVFKGLPEIEGALVVLKNKVALWGSLPRLVRSQFNPDLITRGKSSLIQ